MAKIRTMTPALHDAPEQDNTIKITETRELKLPDPPVIPAGKIAFRMVYHDGGVRDIIGDSRFDCTGKALKQAAQDGMNFSSADIISFKKV